MRLFVGSLLSRENQDFYDAFAAELAARTDGAVRAIPRGSAHVTHAFLGEIDSSRLDEIRDGLRQAVGRHAPAPFRLGRPEVLTAGRVPRLVIAGVREGHREVAAVSRAVAEQLRAQLGLELAPARSPHVTIARFRKHSGPRQAELVRAVLAGEPEERLRRSNVLERVEIVSSTLMPLGPIYEVVRTVALGGD